MKEKIFWIKFNQIRSHFIKFDNFVSNFRQNISNYMYDNIYHIRRILIKFDPFITFFFKLVYTFFIVVVVFEFLVQEEVIFVP